MHQAHRFFGPAVLALWFAAASLACSSSTSTPSTSSTPDASTGGDRPAAIAKLTGNAANGKTIYEVKSSPKCGSCHRADGKGGPVDGLTTPAADLSEPAQHDDAEDIAINIVNGKGKDMPKQAALTDQEIADVIAYLKASFK